MNGNGLHDPREEILEAIWRLEEESDLHVSALAARLPQAREELPRLEGEGLLSIAGDDLLMTEKGRRIARHVIRANRLAARLMADVLELPPDFIEKQACRLEHAIDATLADSLCAFLGHPPTAPDGRAIPPGASCGAEDIEPAIMPLHQVELGRSCRVTFIHPREKGSLAQLSALGLTPGTVIRFRQRSPSVVVDVGETTLALDGAVARNIFVKPVESPAHP